MIVTPLRQDLIDQVHDLMALGEPYIRVRTHSDYWLYARLFSSTCPVALLDGKVIGAVIAFRSQDDPDEIYIQDVMTHPDHRGQHIATRLLTTVREQATIWRCDLMYLTSEPDNTAAQATWTRLGFENTPTDQLVNGVWVTADFKGRGKDRAVYRTHPCGAPT
jgi:ribosomal protein S18 acetylase RimI-like enzyme